jgi:hypothetical protein
VESPPSYAGPTMPFFGAQILSTKSPDIHHDGLTIVVNTPQSF